MIKVKKGSILRIGEIGEYDKNVVKGIENVFLEQLRGNIGIGEYGFYAAKNDFPLPIWQIGVLYLARAGVEEILEQTDESDWDMLKILTHVENKELRLEPLFKHDLVKNYASRYLAYTVQKLIEFVDVRNDFLAKPLKIILDDLINKSYADYMNILYEKAAMKAKDFVKTIALDVALANMKNDPYRSFLANVGVFGLIDTHMGLVKNLEDFFGSARYDSWKKYRSFVANCDNAESLKRQRRKILEAVLDQNMYKKAIDGQNFDDRDIKVVYGELHKIRRELQMELSSKLILPIIFGVDYEILQKANEEGLNEEESIKQFVKYLLEERPQLLAPMEIVVDELMSCEDIDVLQSIEYSLFINNGDSSRRVQNEAMMRLGIVLCGNEKDTGCSEDAIMKKLQKIQKKFKELVE